MLIRLCTCLLLIFSVTAVFAGDRPRIFQTAAVQPSEIDDAGNLSSAEGAAWLKRSKNRVEGRVMARVDTANQPYTIWWVIFNNPDGCTPPACGMDDLADGGIAADVALFNASGAISAASGDGVVDGDGDGVINVDLSVIGREGAGRGSQMPPCPAPFCSNKLRKNNGLCAEIHVDVNRHEFDSDDWVQELTYPEFAQAFAIFPPVGKCNHKKDDD